jgi:K+-sensing histidine kinase KdpD
MLLSLRPALIATGTVLVAAAVRFALSPLLGHDAPLLVFTLPIIASALWAGPHAGLIATLLGAAVGATLFIPPVGSLFVERTADAARIVVFLTEGFLISWLVARVRLERQ